MSSPLEALRKLQEINSESSGEYCVMMYYVNCDLLPTGSTDNPPFGVVFPCGVFSNKREATKVRDMISAETGAHSVVVCSVNSPFPLHLSPNKDTLVYTRNEADSIDVIGKSIETARREKERVKQNIRKEEKEREDPSTMSYLIQKLYQHTVLRTKINAMVTADSDIINSIKEHIKQHPEHKDALLDELKTRLTERGEQDLHVAMVAGYKSLNLDNI